MKTFLDHMHGIEVDGVDLALLLEMIKFIMHLGKSKLNGKVIFLSIILRYIRF